MTFSGQFMKIEPAAIRNFHRELKVAAIVGSLDAQKFAIRTAIQQEVEAVLGAMESLNLIDIQPETRPLVIETISRYATKVSGASS